MTFDDRVQAVSNFGFTERQARFLVLVMRHAGVCVPRQYAEFAGIALRTQGQRVLRQARPASTRAPSASACTTARGSITCITKPLYQAIDQPHSRNRRPVPPRQAIERLMRLDAVSSRNWNGSRRRRRRLRTSDGARCRAVPPARSRHVTAPSARTRRRFPDGSQSASIDRPRGVHCTSRRSRATEEFRSLPSGTCRATPSRYPNWTLRLVFPRSVPPRRTRPIRPSTRRSWSRRSTRRRSVAQVGISRTATKADPRTASPADAGFLEHGQRRFRHARFRRAVPALAEAWRRRLRRPLIDRQSPRR